MRLMIVGTFASLALLAGTAQAGASHDGLERVVAKRAAAPTITRSSIVGVRLGISDRAVRRKLGRPSRRVTYASGYYKLVYGVRKVDVYFTSNRRVDSVETASPKDRTAGGIGPGVTIDVDAYSSSGICRAGGGNPFCVPDPYAEPQTVLYLRPGTGRHPGRRTRDRGRDTRLTIGGRT